MFILSAGCILLVGWWYFHAVIYAWYDDVIADTYWKEYRDSDMVLQRLSLTARNNKLN